MSENNSVFRAATRFITPWQKKLFCTSTLSIDSEKYAATYFGTKEQNKNLLWEFFIACINKETFSKNTFDHNRPHILALYASNTFRLCVHLNVLERK